MLELLELKGLEGETLKFAKAYNAMVEKVNALEQKGSKVDFGKMSEELTELKELKSKVDELDFEKKFTKLENDLTERVNSIQDEIEKKNIAVKNSGNEVVDAIVDTFKSLEIKSFNDLSNPEKMKQLIAGMEIKANIVTTDYTGDVSRTQEVSQIKFPRLRPLAFMNRIYRGFVSNAKSILMWTEGTYTDNTGYAGEGTGATTENKGVATEKYRKMAKIAAKQYMTAEIFEDLPQFAQRLNDQLTANANLFVDKKILSGDGNDATQPNHIYGIISQGSTDFDADAATELTSPNVMDLVDACATQAEVNEYIVNTIWMNPRLAYELRRTKDSTGQYIINVLPTGEMVMGGYVVIKTTELTDNQMLVADASLIQLWIKRNLELKIGQFGSDTENDRYSAFLFMRAQCLVETEDKKGVIWVSDVAAALEGIKKVVA